MLIPGTHPSGSSKPAAQKISWYTNGNQSVTSPAKLWRWPTLDWPPLNWFPIGTLFKLGYITPIQLTGTSIRINVDKLAHTSSAGGVVLKLSNFGEQLQLKSHKSLDIKNTDCRTYYWMNGMTKILTRSWVWYTDGKAAKCLVEGSGCPK